MSPQVRLAGFARGEIALDQIGKRRGGDVGDGGADLFAPAVFGVDAVVGLRRSTRLWLTSYPRRAARRSSGGLP